MTKIEKQQEKITNLLKLISENPELEIMPMVANDVSNDEFSHSLGKWGTAEVDYYRCLNERIYFKSHDFEELVEKFIDENYDNYDYKDLTDGAMEEMAESKVEAYAWVKAIIVNIDPT